MHGILFQVFYSTRHNAKLPVSVGKLFVFIHASTGTEACEKALVLLRDAGQEGEIRIVGCERIV